jgi:hypothetical protein
MFKRDSVLSKRLLQEAKQSCDEQVDASFKGPNMRCCPEIKVNNNQ